MVLMKSPLLITLRILTIVPLAASALLHGYVRQSVEDVTRELGIVIQSEAALIRA
jgi:hypothetical protein